MPAPNLNFQINSERLDFAPLRWFSSNSDFRFAFSARKSILVPIFTSLARLGARRQQSTFRGCSLTGKLGSTIHKHANDPAQRASPTQPPQGMVLGTSNGPGAHAHVQFSAATPKTAPQRLSMEHNVGPKLGPSSPPAALFQQVNEGVPPQRGQAGRCMGQLPEPKNQQKTGVWRRRGGPRGGHPNPVLGPQGTQQEGGQGLPLARFRRLQQTPRGRKPRVPCLSGSPHSCKGVNQKGAKCVSARAAVSGMLIFKSALIPILMA